MTALKTLLALCLTLIAAAVAAAPVRPVEGVAVTVATDAGRLEGREADGVRAFRAIPYAAAPVGPLRWRPPQPPAPWSGTRPAVKFGDDCLQHPLPVAIDPGSGQPMGEDCLYLNVWGPAGRARRLPVMIWIHGGGFVLGSGSLAASDGAALARRGVVVVSLNCRLGRFGFFAHPALTRDHPGEATGNFGLMDQIAALKWVRRNIAAFGGDPARITIFGESAGGGSVLALMGSPMARGLFKGAIVESGGGRDRLATLETANHESRAGYAAGAAFAAKAGLKDADAAQLRTLPAAAVLGDLGFLNNTNRDDYAGMVIDGRMVTADPAAIFARGGEAPVPLIIGFNSSELGALVSVTGPWTNFEAAQFGPHEADLRQAYDPAGGDAALRADFLSDLIFVEPARRAPVTPAKFPMSSTPSPRSTPRQACRTASWRTPSARFGPPSRGAEIQTNRGDGPGHDTLPPRIRFSTSRPPAPRRCQAAAAPGSISWRPTRLRLDPLHRYAVSRHPGGEGTATAEQRR